MIRGDLQYIFIAREKLSSFTVTKLIPNERHDTLREAIITLTSELAPSTGLVIQVDNACSLKKLVGDAELNRHLIGISLARKKNKNSNPIAERAVQEFRLEKLKFKPEGGALSDIERALITASLNKKIRNRGVSSKEIIMNRDQNTLNNLNLDTKRLNDEQLKLRKLNHPQSEKCKSRNGRLPNKPHIWPGALVFLKKDLTKLRGRELYIVIKVEEGGEWCWIKKSVKQLRTENYKVNSTEICLAPNQYPPPNHELSSDEDQIITTKSSAKMSLPESSSHHTSRQRIEPDTRLHQNDHGYNLRRKPRINYKIRRVKYSNREKEEEQLPPRFGWNSLSSSSDEEDFRDVHTTPIISKFSNWCSQQPPFIPKSAVFLHWFRDKHPSLDILKLEQSVKDIANNIAKNSVFGSTLHEEMIVTDTFTPSNEADIRDSDEDTFNDTIVVENTQLKKTSLVPTARSSSTSLDFLSSPPQPVVSSEHCNISGSSIPRNSDSQVNRTDSVILCPRNTCDISSLLSQRSVSPNLPLPVNHENYPLLHTFAGIQRSLGRHPEGARENQQFSPPPKPPPFPTSERKLRPRDTMIDYFSLHNYGKQGHQAWTELEEGEDLELLSKEGERKTDGEQGGARE